MLVSFLISSGALRGSSAGPAGQVPGYVWQFRYRAGKSLIAAVPVKRAFWIARIFFRRRRDERTKFYVIRQNFVRVFDVALADFFQLFFLVVLFFVFRHFFARFPVCLRRAI